MTENRIERLQSIQLLRGVPAPDTQAALFNEIHFGRGILMRTDSKRVSVWAVRFAGVLFKIVVDAQRHELASVIEIEDEDLRACDCGHKHCHKSCKAVTVLDESATPCCCQKCECPLCQKYDAVKL